METVINVSVVIPLFNKGPYVTRAIDSVLHQTVSDFEMVVVDDGSSDDGAEIVATYLDDRIRLIKQENQGVSAARNRGINEARSDFIAFLDADDEWEPDHLETLLRLNSNNPEAGAYATSYSIVESEGLVQKAQIKGLLPEPWEGIMPDYFRSASLGEPPICSSSVAIRREIFEKVGFFKVGESFGEDQDLWGRIALDYPIAFSWRGQAFYRRDAGSRLCLSHRITKEMPLLQTLRDRFPGTEAPGWIGSYEARTRYRYIDLLIESGQKGKAFSNLISEQLLSADWKRFFKTLLKILLPLKMISFIRTFRKK